MPNVDQQRKIKEAAAYKREEEHRAERRIIEQKERDRAKKDLERKRYDDMAKAKHLAKKADEMKEQEAKQERMMKELEARKAQNDRICCFSKLRHTQPILDCRVSRIRLRSINSKFSSSLSNRNSSRSHRSFSSLSLFSRSRMNLNNDKVT